MKTLKVNEKVKNLSFEQKFLVLRFLAKYPFEAIDAGHDEFSQIIKINFAAQEITLRNFCEYSIEEIVDSKGFKNKSINKRWKVFLNKLRKDKIDENRI
jgi:hypothetical protein